MNELDSLEQVSDQPEKRFVVKRWHLLLMLLLLVLLIAAGFHGVRYFSSSVPVSISTKAKPSNAQSLSLAAHQVAFPFSSLQSLQLIGVLSLSKESWAYVKDDRGEVVRIQVGDRLTSQQMQVKKVGYNQVELFNPANRQLTKWGVS